MTSKCYCALNADGTKTMTLCPMHAATDPCLTMSSVTGRRRKGTIRRGACTNCGWKVQGEGTMKTPMETARYTFAKMHSQAAEACENEILAHIESAIETDRAQREFTEGELDALLSEWDAWSGDVDGFYQKWTAKINREGGVVKSPTWPDGCPMTVNELPNGDNAPGHVDCSKAQRAADIAILADAAASWAESLTDNIESMRADDEDRITDQAEHDEIIAAINRLTGTKEA